MLLLRGVDCANRAASGCPGGGTRLSLSGAGMSAQCALASYRKRLYSVRFTVSGLALPHARVFTRKICELESYERIANTIV